MGLTASLASSRPRVLILGDARHGKDTVAEMLRADHEYTFRSSSHFLASRVVRRELAKRGLTYPTFDAFYDDRQNHRAAWREIIANYNDKDPARLAKAILLVADVYVGMRSKREYEASKELFDVIVWVDASCRGIGREDRSSMELAYDPAAMWLLDNSGSLEDLRLTVAMLSFALAWTDRPTSLVVDRALKPLPPA